MSRVKIRGITELDRALLSFEIGPPAKVFQAYLPTVLWCWAFKVLVLNGQDISLCTPRVGNDKVKVLITEMNESDPLSKCRK
jgi:hypothetical protein